MTFCKKTARSEFLLWFYRVEHKRQLTVGRRHSYGTPISTANCCVKCGYHLTWRFFFIFYSICWRYWRNMWKCTFPGDSIRPVDPTGQDRIRHRIASESDHFGTKTDRIRHGYRRIPNYRIPDRITSEKIRSYPFESEYRIMSDPLRSVFRENTEHASFYNR